MGIFSKKRKTDEPGVKSSDSSDVTLTNEKQFYSKPTGLRLFTACLYLIALVFLILVEIGNISNKAIIRQTYFLKIDLANIIPETVPNANLINTIAQSIGLHDFYQVGLWNYCAGNNGEGITTCSSHKAGYWFNPVQIILSELLSGASIALPTNVVSALSLVHTASTWMFACFMVGTCLTFLCIFLAPLGFSKKPRWSHKAKRIFGRSLPITILTFLALLFTGAGAAIATIMFVIFKNTFKTAATEVNIEAQLGPEMLAFEWTAVGLLLLGFLMQIGTCCGICCCDGRKKAIRKSAQLPVSEK